MPTRSSVIGGCNSPHSHLSSVTTISAARSLKNHTDGTASRTLPAQPPQCATPYSRTGHVPSLSRLSITTVPLIRGTTLSTRCLQTRHCTERHPCAHSFSNFRRNRSCSRLTASSCLEATFWSLPCLRRMSPLSQVSPYIPLSLYEHAFIQTQLFFRSHA